MGQLIGVYPHSSRVMLLSDKEHSLSVRLERTGMRCNCIWNRDLGRLKWNMFRRAIFNIQVGIKYLVQVWANIFLQGYLVGTVSKG